MSSNPRGFYMETLSKLKRKKAIKKKVHYITVRHRLGEFHEISGARLYGGRMEGA